MRYALISLALFLGACASPTGPGTDSYSGDLAKDAINGCSTAAHAACTGQNPSKHVP